MPYADPDEHRRRSAETMRRLRADPDRRAAENARRRQSRHAAAADPPQHPPIDDSPYLDQLDLLRQVIRQRSPADWLKVNALAAVEIAASAPPADTRLRIAAHRIIADCAKTLSVERPERPAAPPPARLRKVAG